MVAPGNGESGSPADPDPMFDAARSLWPQITRDEWPVLGRSDSYRGIVVAAGGQVLLVPPLPLRARHRAVAVNDLLARGWGERASRLRAMTGHEIPGATVTASPTLGALLDRTPGATSAVLRLALEEPHGTLVAQMVDAPGRTVGYAKLALRQESFSRVRAESWALKVMADDGADGSEPAHRGLPMVPPLLWSGEIEGAPAMITAPMPPGLRRWRKRDGPRALVSDAVARRLHRAGRFPMTSSEAPPRSLLDVLQQRLAALQVSPHAPTASAAHLWAGLVATKLADHSPREAGWHGDWAPWNFRRGPDAMWVWDWEHASPRAPHGLDLLHYWFVGDLVARRLTIEAAVHRAIAHAPGLLANRQPRAAVGTTICVYLAEHWSRHTSADPRPTADSQRGLIMVDEVRKLVASTGPTGFAEPG